MASESELHVSDGQGMPCRHCLANIAEGDPYLIIAYRPFPDLQPYAETGPVFLHAQDCEAYNAEMSVPAILTTSKDYLLRGYSADDRIVYGTGAVTPVDAIDARAADLLERSDIALCPCPLGPQQLLPVPDRACMKMGPEFTGPMKDSLFRSGDHQHGLRGVALIAKRLGDRPIGDAASMDI